jgi:5,6,7,8-tetrahydromethanopterin hydro-lyase
MAEHTMYIGEALVGEGNEIAHIDLLIGSKTGPVGAAFAAALATQSEGHSNLLAVLEPNLLCKPATILITKVTIKGMRQAVQMFGPAQYAVAKAVADCLAAGTLPSDSAEDLVIICGVFIHPEAENNAKILDFNYAATKLSIERAMRGEPSAQQVIAGKDTAKHPFSGKA